MGHNRNLFMLHGAAGKGRKLCAVVPHALGHDPSVVCDHPFVDQYKILRMKRCPHHVNIFKGNPCNDEQGCNIQTGKGNAFPCPVLVGRLEPEGIHGFYRFGLPVWDYLGVEFIKPEMFADVKIEVVLIAFIAKQGIGPGQCVHVDEIPEAVDLGLLVGKPPGFKVEVEIIMLHYILLYTVKLFEGTHLFDACKPWVIPPLPDLGRHDVCIYQSVKKFREYEDLHVG